MSEQNEQEVKNRMSRRFFLKAGGIAMGAAVLGGVAGCGDNTTTIKTITESNLPSNWDATADIVMVGFGGAAATATINATAQGAKVLILEAQAQGGGSTAICGGCTWLGGGTPLQTQNGFSETADEFYQATLATVGIGADEDIVKAYCDNSVATYSMLVNAGVTYGPYKPGYWMSPPDGYSLVYDNEKRLMADGAITKAVPHCHFALPAKDSSGNYEGTRSGNIWQSLQAATLATSVDVRYNIQVTRLIVNSSGRVVGVAAVKTATDDNGVPQVADNTELFYKANKAVLICTGGFIENVDMVEQYVPRDLQAWRGGNVMDIGTGIKMAQAIGADTRLMSASEDWLPSYRFDTNMVKGVVVNQDGIRFTSEDVSGPVMGKWLVNNYPKCWVIIDQTIYATLALGTSADYGMPSLTKSDTIADLATAIGAKYLQDTLDRYNADAATGVDQQFGKDSTVFQPITTGPFYAMPFLVGSVFTQTNGGIRINPKAQVLDTKGNVIPGLYAAGSTTSHILAQYYATGGSTGGAFTFGRLAGLQMIQETAWDSTK
jgi:3-oxo-5alpha-steroid 4-dehydrogenase